MCRFSDLVARSLLQVGSCRDQTGRLSYCARCLSGSALQAGTCGKEGRNQDGTGCLHGSMESSGAGMNHQGCPPLEWNGPALIFPSRSVGEFGPPSGCTLWARGSWGNPGRGWQLRAPAASPPSSWGVLKADPGSISLCPSQYISWTLHPKVLPLYFSLNFCLMASEDWGAGWEEVKSPI